METNENLSDSFVALYEEQIYYDASSYKVQEILKIIDRFLKICLKQTEFTEQLARESRHRKAFSEYTAYGKCIKELVKHNCMLPHVSDSELLTIFSLIEKEKEFCLDTVDFIHIFGLDIEGLNKELLKSIIKRMYEFHFLNEGGIRHKKLKQIIYNKRMNMLQERLSNPSNVYDPPTASWLNEQIAKMIKEVDDPCTDNIRFANIRKSSQMRRYKRKFNQGCCGFEDRIVTHPEFGTFKIGCNYGH